MATNSAEQEIHEPETASTLLTVNGSHRFTIFGYSHHKEIGRGKYLTSAPFVIGGYEWVIRCYPDSKYQNKSYLSFFLELTSKDKEVKTRFGFTMLDQNGNPSTLTFIAGTETSFASNSNCWGCKNFAERERFEASDCLKNDSFTIMCTITIVKPSRTELTKCESVTMPPTNLDLQLVQLLESDKGADVTFEVNKKYFKAHKCVLAARSSVFNAQFFGPMKEKKKRNIILDDIKPEVFRFLLHFMYSDSIHKLVEDHPVMYQHLLVAADLYDVQRLKLICENELSKKLEIENVATTLTLAEQHNCPELKSSCFKFISSLQIFAEVIKTDGFEHLTQSCPFILKEILTEVIKSNRFEHLAQNCPSILKEILTEAMKTNGFKHLIQNCPSILKEILDEVKNTGGFEYLTQSCPSILNEILGEVIKNVGFEHLTQSWPSILKEIVESSSSKKEKRRSFSCFACFSF